MKKAGLYRCRSAVLAAFALAAVPAGSAWGTAHAARPSGMAYAKAPAKAKKYKGPIVDMRWGPVQARITVKGKKITAVSIATSPDSRRSQFIDDQAVPILRQETLKAQSANIDSVSGATMTSDAYIESLQGALKKAHVAK